jgi:hypothetical protein
MPRTNTLPTELKGLRMVDVKVTYTTWESLQKLYLAMISERKERLEQYYEQIVDAYDPYWDMNYYAQKDFKKVFDSNSVQHELDVFKIEDREFLGECLDIVLDIQRCDFMNNEFMNEDLSDEYFEFKKTLSLTFSNEEDGKMQRKMIWRRAYDSWKDKNKSYMKDVGNRKSHYEFHKTTVKGCRFCEIQLMGLAEDETREYISKKRKFDEESEVETLSISETQSTEFSVLSTSSNFYCQNCAVSCRTKAEFIAHCETDKHKKNKFVCLGCDYRTNTKFNYDKHCKSIKHKTQF